MHDMDTPTSNPLTRREALLGLLNAMVIPSIIPSHVVEASPTGTNDEEPPFVPENDYPFFGGATPEDY